MYRSCPPNIPVRLLTFFIVIYQCIRIRIKAGFGLQHVWEWMRRRIWENSCFDESLFGLKEVFFPLRFFPLFPWREVDELLFFKSTAERWTRRLLLIQQWFYRNTLIIYLEENLSFFRSFPVRETLGTPTKTPPKRNQKIVNDKKYGGRSGFELEFFVAKQPKFSLLRGWIPPNFTRRNCGTASVHVTSPRNHRLVAVTGQKDFTLKCSSR